MPTIKIITGPYAPRRYMPGVDIPDASIGIFGSDIDLNPVLIAIVHPAHDDEPAYNTELRARRIAVSLTALESIPLEDLEANTKGIYHHAQLNQA